MPSPLRQSRQFRRRASAFVLGQLWHQQHGEPGVADAGQVNRQLADAVVLRLLLGMGGGRQRLGVHDLKPRACGRKNLRAKLRAGLLEAGGAAVVLNFHGGLRVHEPPKIERLVRLKLVLHQNLVAVQEGDPARDLAGMLRIGGREIGDGERPLRCGLKASDPGLGRLGPGRVPGPG